MVLLLYKEKTKTKKVLSESSKKASLLYHKGGSSATNVIKKVNLGFQSRVDIKKTNRKF